MDCAVLRLSFGILMLAGACTSMRSTVTHCQGGICDNRIIFLTCPSGTTIQLQDLFYSDKDLPTLTFSKYETDVVCRKCSHQRSCRIRVGIWHEYSNCSMQFNCTGPFDREDDICDRRFTSSTTVTHPTTSTITPSTSTTSTSTPSTSTPSTSTPSTSTPSTSTPSTTKASKTTPSTATARSSMQATVTTLPWPTVYTTKASSVPSMVPSRKTTDRGGHMKTTRAHSATRAITPVSTLKGGPSSHHYQTTRGSHKSGSGVIKVTTRFTPRITGQEAAEKGDTPGKLSTGVLVGIGAGALVLLVLVVVGVCFVKRRLRPPRRRKPDRSTQNPGYEPNHVPSSFNDQQGMSYDDRLRPPIEIKTDRSAQNPGYESNHITSSFNDQQGIGCDDRLRPPREGKTDRSAMNPGYESNHIVTYGDRLRPPRERKMDRSAMNPGYEPNHIPSSFNDQQGIACDDINIREAAYAVINDTDNESAQQPRNLHDYENTKQLDYDKIRFHDNGVRFIVDPGYGTLEHIGQEDVDSSYSHVTLSGRTPETGQSDLYSHLQNSGTCSHENKIYPDSDTENLYNHCNDTRMGLAVEPEFDCYSHLSSSTGKPDP